MADAWSDDVLQGDCLFCRIIKGEIPSTKIFEDDHTYAFLDINPMNRGHTLVIPKFHSRDLLDLPDDYCSALLRTCKTIAPAIVAATDSKGFNVIVNNGAAAGQIVFHSHTHVVPRILDDGHRHWSAIEDYDMPAEAADIAARITELL